MAEPGNSLPQKRKFGQFPWKYRESFTIALSLVVIGIIIELFKGGQGIAMPVWPVNLLMLLLFVAYIIIFHFLVDHPVKKWLSGVPAAVSSITAFTLLTLVMGFVRQGENNSTGLLSKTGIHHIVSSWPYLLCSLYLLFVLSFTIIRRALPLTLKNIAFVLNHLGLWILVVSASLGSADAIKLGMTLTGDQATFAAFDHKGNAYNPGFALQLLRFNIDEYPPELGIIDTRTGSLLNPKQHLMKSAKSAKADFGQWTLEVSEFFAGAQKDSAGFYASNAYGNAPAAFVSAYHRITGQHVTGWVSPGSPFIYPKSLELGNYEAVAMTSGRPRKYTSTIRAYTDMGHSEDFSIEVNKPAKFMGWTIYQTGYDVPMGKWSKRSMVQIVRDPWLPAVYTGIFMILAGALYMLWTGKSRTNNKNQEL